MRRMTVLAASVAACMGAQAQPQLDQGAAAMFYVSQPVGVSAGQQKQFSYGLRMNYGIGPAALMHPRGSLVDFRLQQGRMEEVRLNGVPFATRDKLSNELTIGGKEVSDGVLIGAAVVLGVGISCATENWPCEDDDDAPPPPVEAPL